MSVKRGNAKRSSQTQVSCGMQLCCVARILYHHVQRESVVLLALLPIHTFNKIANFWDGSLQSMNHFTSANGLGVLPLLDRQMNPSNCPSLFQPHPFQLSLCYHRNHHTAKLDSPPYLECCFGEFFEFNGLLSIEPCAAAMKLRSRFVCTKVHWLIDILLLDCSNCLARGEQAHHSSKGGL